MAPLPDCRIPKHDYGFNNPFLIPLIVCTVLLALAIATGAHAEFSEAGRKAIEAAEARNKADDADIRKLEQTNCEDTAALELEIAGARDRGLPLNQLIARFDKVKGVSHNQRIETNRLAALIYSDPTLTAGEIYSHALASCASDSESSGSSTLELPHASASK